jgi:N-sulfoglucosamine sulfohydrolase
MECPFPRAKANNYSYGVHVPLAVRFPKHFPGGRIVEDPVSFTDFAPTILELTGTDTEGMLPISGRSFLHILKSREQGVVDDSRKYVFSGRERHSSSRFMNLGYPVRSIHSKDHLLIWNMKPDRWPAGDPQAIKPGTESELLPMYGIDEKGVHHSEWAFTDIDMAPSKAFIIENWKDPKVRPFFDLAHAKRPEFEFFDLKADPYCLNNISGNILYEDIEKEMKEALMTELIKSEDPRMIGPDREVFDSYIRYSPIRNFPAWD